MQGVAFRFGLIFLSLVMICAWQSAIGKEVGRHRHCRMPQKTHREPPHADNPRIAEGAPPQEPRREVVVLQNQPPEPKEYKHPCDSPANREEDDTCSQFRSANAADDSLIVAKDALREAGRQADYSWYGLVVGGIAAAATAYAAIEAGRAAKAAAASVNLGKQTSEYQLRAYLSIKPNVLIFAKDMVPTATFIIKNNGQTPAHNMRYVAGVECLPPLPENQESLALPIPGERIPTQPVHPGAEVNGEGIARDKPANAYFDDIVNGTGYPIHLFGTVSYNDIFGVKRETRFCAYIDQATLKRFIEAKRGEDSRVGAKSGGVAFVDFATKRIVVPHGLWIFTHVHNDAT